MNKVTIKFDINLTEINAWDTAIKAYWNNPDDWHEGIDESDVMIETFSKAHNAYLHAYGIMRETTPILGDWVVLERSHDGKVMRGEFIQEDNFQSPAWVQIVLDSNMFSFKRLSINDNDYAEWRLTADISGRV